MGKREGTLVIYTDGGARPNPGNAGFGVHAYVGIHGGKAVGVQGKYLATNKGYMKKTDFGTPKLDNRVFKDLNLYPRLSKKLEPLELGPVFDFYGYRADSDTNNMAELDGAIYALQYIERIVNSIPDDIHITNVVMLLDSTYTILFIKKILSDNLNLSNVNTNVNHVKRLKVEIDKVSTKYVIQCGKVPAHEDNLGNNRADMLATMAVHAKELADMGDNTEYIKLETGYWKDSKIDTSLFYAKQLFNFYPDRGVDSSIYYGINYKELSDMGKKISNVTYTIIKLDEPNNLINSVVKIIRDKLGNNFFPYVIMLNNLMNRKVLRDLLRYKDNYLIVDEKRTLTVTTASGLVVAEVLSPQALSSLVMFKFLDLHTKLDNNLDNIKQANTRKLEITNHIYTTNIKGKVILKPEIKNDTYIIKVPYKHNVDYRAFTIRVKPKLDLPSRNTLNKYASLEPKVMLVLSWSGNILTYSTYITLKDGSVIMSENIYANKAIMKEIVKKK